MKTGYSSLRCGLIGEHLGHSFSVMIHELLGDYSFVLRELAPSELEAFVKSDELDAYCVTIPYKKAVMPFLDVISPEAQAIGAVNVVVNGKDGKRYGYNTDYFGFDYMLGRSGVSVEGKKAVVLGGGGASATACALLRDKGAKSIVVIDKDDNTPEGIAPHRDAEIIVNTTPVGMYPKNMISPISLDDFPDTQAVLDVVYNPARTALMLDAEKRGIAAVGGLSMLVAQAAKGFEHFTGDSREEGIIGSVLAQITARSSNLILVGMPGCGKSSVGAIIADKLGRDFLDADAEFEKMHSITPADAIRTLGEEKFREMETETVASLGKLSGKVIATGGGVVTRERNYPLLHQNGVIVFLERDISLLPTNNRPLSQGNSLEKLYNSRIDSYRRFADITVESTGIIEKTAELIISAFLEFVNQEVSDK